MKGFVQDIESLAVKNTDFRRVLYTAKSCQLVIMALKPKEEIGPKSTSWTSFFAWRRVPAKRSSMAFGRRSGRASRFSSRPDESQHHQYRKRPLKLYTIYSPPNHRDGVVHHTRAEAEADDEHFDGKTTE